MNKNVGQYYKQYNNGDVFTNVELIDALLKFGRLMDDLDSLGPIFVLSKREISRVYYGLEDYYYARYGKLYRR